MNERVIKLLNSAQLLNITQPVPKQRQLLQLYRQEDEDEPYFVDYVPPARDTITLPRNVVYVLVGVMLIIMATYAIVGHLINDLMHDLAGNLQQEGCKVTSTPPPHSSSCVHSDLSVCAVMESCSPALVF